MKNMKKKSILLLISVAVLLLGVVGATVAYLTTQTTPITNTFTPAQVSVKVEDTVSNGVKSNVKITNTGDTSAYIRVAVVANWCDEQGNPVPHWVEKNGTLVAWDVTDELDISSDWTQNGKYYYYNSPVAANNYVVPFDRYTPGKGPEGAHLVMDIIAQGIQAEGMGSDVTDAQSAFAHAAGN